MTPDEPRGDLIDVELSRFGALFFCTETPPVRKAQANRVSSGDGAFEERSRLVPQPTSMRRIGMTTSVAPDVDAVFRCDHFFDRSGGGNGRRWRWRRRRRRFANRARRARARQVLTSHPVVVPIEVVWVADKEIALGFSLSGEIRAVVVKRLSFGSLGSRDGKTEDGYQQDEEGPLDRSRVSGSSQRSLGRGDLQHAADRSGSDGTRTRDLRRDRSLNSCI